MAGVLVRWDDVVSVELELEIGCGEGGCTGSSKCVETVDDW